MFHFDITSLEKKLISLILCTMNNLNNFRHAIFVRNKVGVAEQMWEPACSVIRQAVDSNFMSPVHRLWAYFARKLAIILIMSSTVDIANIIIQNWSVVYTLEY